jgi:hypothetical protein
MPTSDATPSPHHSVVVEIGPDMTDEELDELAHALYEQMSRRSIAEHGAPTRDVNTQVEHHSGEPIT